MHQWAWSFVQIMARNSLGAILSLENKGYISDWPIETQYADTLINHLRVPEQQCIENVVCKYQPIGRGVVLLTHWGRYKMTAFFPDDSLKCIFLYENVLILIKNSLNLIPKAPINDIPALVQIMAWRRPGDKPLSEPMVVTLLAHICVTRPQWVHDAHIIQGYPSQRALSAMCKHGC